MFESIASGSYVGEIGLGCADSARQCSLKWATSFRSTATHLDQACIECIREAGQAVCEPEGASNAEKGQSIGSWGKLIISGAGHDSVHTNKRCASAMIFVPCRDGISHNPREHASSGACADGANVLLGAMLRYNSLLAKNAEKAIS